LPSALDNRPLKFEEFLRSIDNFIAVSATPADWELSMAQGNLVEQLVRPTGIVDPEVEIRPIKGQVRDVAGGTFRHEKFEKYKATRVKADQDLYDQIPLVHQVVEAFGLPIFEKKGFEADDVIGTIAAALGKDAAKPEVFIVTGDMDTLQLVTNQVKVYTLRKGLNDIVVYDPKEVAARYGFGPELIVDYKALRGARYLL
jgi:hypothetical protein